MYPVSHREDGCALSCPRKNMKGRLKKYLKVAGFPLLYDALGKKKDVQLDLSGNTVIDLIETLTRRYGRSIKLALLDGEGQISLDIRILKNGTEDLGERRMVASLENGDTLYFMGPT
jgi:hypothetical protein